LLDNAGGNGISNTVGFLNLVFLLTFGFVLIGVRFYYSLGSSTIVSAFYIWMLYNQLGARGTLLYFLYQIFTVFFLCALLGYTREFVLRVDFATQVELAEAREALARQSQSDTRYLAWLRQLAEFLRHEVRHPVAQINSSIEVAQIACKDNDRVAPYLATAALGSQQVWNLVERASRATDAEAFVRQCQPQWVDLGHLLSDQVDAFQQTTSGIGFRLQSPAIVRVYCDPNLIKEAVGNLLSNAMSFAVEESAVEVATVVDGAHVIIRVSNKGPPIDGDTETLFGPFASTRSGPSSEHQGLGLYLVRLIAEQHGGPAAIANLADRSGVQATISLPLAT
jgi:signal transduction histidine kinase